MRLRQARYRAVHDALEERLDLREHLLLARRRAHNLFEYVLEQGLRWVWHGSKRSTIVLCGLWGHLLQASG